MKCLFLEADEIGQWYQPHGAHEEWQDHGMGLLVTLANEHGYPFDVMTLKAMHSWAEFRSLVRGYDLLVMNVRSWRYIYAKRAAEIFKMVNPNGRVWVGGMHTTVALPEMESVPEFDVIVKGEAEGTWLELLETGGLTVRVNDPDDPSRAIPGSVGMFRNLDDLPFIDREKAWPKTPNPAWPLEGPGGWGPGTRAATMMTQRMCPFHCLTPDARIALSDGRTMPIAEVLAGRYVWGTDLATGQRRRQLVTASKRTYALRYDILEVRVDGGSHLRCTPDHKVYTRRGWVEAQHLTTGDEVALGLPYPHAERPDALRMDERARTNETARSSGEGTCDEGDPRIPCGAKRAHQVAVAEPRLPRDASPDGNGALCGGHIPEQDTQDCRGTGGYQYSDEGQQSDEPPRDPRTGQPDTPQPVSTTSRTDESQLGRRQDTAPADECRCPSGKPRADARTQPYEAPGSRGQGNSGYGTSAPTRPSALRQTVDAGWDGPQSGGEQSVDDSGGHALPVCRGRRLLDWTVPERQVPQSRLYLQDGAGQDCRTPEWGVLAQGTPGAQRCGRDGRLCSDGVPSARNLGYRTEGPDNGKIQGQDLVGWARVLSVTSSVPPSPVYDLEVLPDHNFFANGILVHNCSFCFPAERDHFQCGPRRRSVDNVLAELEYIEQSWGDFGTVVFHEGEFLQHPKWLQEFLDKYPKSKARPFWAACRADLLIRWKPLSEALVREANWHTISVGLESGNDDVLKIMNKGTTVAQNLECIEFINDLGDRMVAEGKRPPVIFSNVMLATPGESREAAFDTVRMLGRIKRNIPSISWFTPYPGSTLGNQVIAEGKSLDSHKRYLRFPNEAKMQGIDYQFYVDLFNGKYDRETGVDMRAMMAHQGNASEAV